MGWNSCRAGGLEEEFSVSDNTYETKPNQTRDEAKNLQEENPFVSATRRHFH